MGESYKYYFVMVICSFVRGNVMYILSKLISKKGMQIAAFPKEILGVLVITMGMVGRFLMISQKIVFGSAE